MPIRASTGPMKGLRLTQNWRVVRLLKIRWVGSIRSQSVSVNSPAPANGIL